MKISNLDIKVESPNLKTSFNLIGLQAQMISNYCKLQFTKKHPIFNVREFSHIGHNAMSIADQFNDIGRHLEGYPSDPNGYIPQANEIQIIHTVPITTN